MPKALQPPSPKSSLQLALLPNAEQAMIPDPGCRKAVVEILARLLLEAVDSQRPSEEGRDDPA
jgi:hypothetical protein